VGADIPRFKRKSSTNERVSDSRLEKRTAQSLPRPLRTPGEIVPKVDHQVLPAELTQRLAGDERLAQLARLALDGGRWRRAKPKRIELVVGMAGLPPKADICRVTRMLSEPGLGGQPYELASF
jgi:hypothetical protein